MQDRMLDQYAAGQLGLAENLWVRLNLNFSESARQRLSEIKDNIRTEIELKDALLALPDPGEPSVALSERMNSCKIHAGRQD